MEQQAIVETGSGCAVSAEETRLRKTALRQLEWADTYLLAFANLELEDFDLNQGVDDIRLRLVAVELRLRRLIAS